MKLRIALFTLAFALTPSIAAAAGSAGATAPALMNPGLWEMTIDMQMSGVPVKLPAQTYQRCVTKEDIAKFHGVPQPRNTGDMTCSMKKFDRSGNTLTYTMVCTGKRGHLRMDGTTTFDSRDAYHGTMHMTGQEEGHPIDMTTSVAAQRTGDCSQ